MGNTIGIAICIGLICAIAKTIKRLRTEMQELQESNQRFDEAQRKIRQDVNSFKARQTELEREQLRLAKEQKKQHDQLVKHEKRIADLEFRITQAESDIDHWNDHLSGLFALLDMAESNLEGTVMGSREQEKYQRKVITLTNQIHNAESRLNKAKHAKAMAERELSA